MRARLTLLGPQGSCLDIDLHELLTPELREQARREANLWIKRLRLAPYGTETMRTRFLYRDDSLWWFTELYLHKMRRIDAAVAATLALEAARDRHAPAALAIDAGDPVLRAVAEAFGRTHRLPVELRGPARPPSGPAAHSYLRALTARLSRLRPHSRPAFTRSPAVLAFVHAAFWRGSPSHPDLPASEHYIGPVLDALARRLAPGELACVGVGPGRNFRARRWWDPLAAAANRPPVLPVERLAPARALRGSHALWQSRRALGRHITAGDGVRDAAVFRGLDLWPVLEPELHATAWLQWPWAARAMDEAGAALDALAPGLVVTYAEAGGWGRALMLEARRRRIPSAGLQHGFIYRHWLNYLHEPDELATAGETPGFPRPDRTFVFDRLTADHLQQAGCFPPEAVMVTGNPRLDVLAARVSEITPADRTGIRRRLGVDGDRRLALLAAKHSEIRGEMPALRAALAALPQVRLAVKPHPAETPDVYVELDGLSNVALLPASADLAELLAASDAIVTMNSTVAVDGLVLGVPALVLGLPNNLSPFVDAGVMAGAGEADGLRGALEALLYDQARRHQLAEAGRAFVAEAGLSPDGRAADRTADAILRLRGSAE